MEGTPTVSKHSLRFAVLSVAGTALFLGLLSPCAEAQPKLYPRVEVLAAGGALFPLNEFKDNADAGYLYSFQAGWRVAKSSSVGVSFTRSVTQATDTFRQNNMVPAGSKAEFALWYWSVYYKQVAFEATFRPYIRIHMGAVDVDPNVDGTEVQKVTVKFAMAGGFGLQWKDRWPVGAYTELLYHQAILQENDPLTQSDRRQFLTLRFGLSYDFL
jgi:hypothetical protein